MYPIISTRKTPCTWGWFPVISTVIYWEKSGGSHDSSWYNVGLASSNSSLGLQAVEGKVVEHLPLFTRVLAPSQVVFSPEFWLPSTVKTSPPEIPSKVHVETALAEFFTWTQSVIFEVHGISSDPLVHQECHIHWVMDKNGSMKVWTIDVKNVVFWQMKLPHFFRPSFSTPHENRHGILSSWLSSQECLVLINHQAPAATKKTRKEKKQSKEEQKGPKGTKKRINDKITTASTTIDNYSTSPNHRLCKVRWMWSPCQPTVTRLSSPKDTHARRAKRSAEGNQCSPLWGTTEVELARLGLVFSSSPAPAWTPTRLKRKNATNRKGFVNGNHVTNNSNDE